MSSRIVDHQATQPLYLPEKYIKACTDTGDLVVDPWMGSGTTGCAALSLSRLFTGFDLVEEYVESADKRLQALREGNHGTC